MKKLPNDRKKKDIKAFFLISMITLSSMVFFLNLNAPISKELYSSDLPRINITSQFELSNESVISTFELIDSIDSERTVLLNTSIKFRGKSASSLDKKGYRIELDKKISLLGMRKDDDWQLMAMYLDFPRMRIKTAMQLWNSLQHTYDDSDRFYPLPDSKYVNLFFNNNYQGLYLLAEKQDKKLFGLSDSDYSINTSLIFQPLVHTNLTGEYNPDLMQWEQDWPNYVDGDNCMNEILTELYDFISLSDDDTFFHPFNGIYSIFDKLNLIDYYLFNNLIFHRDTWMKNYFLVRDSFPCKFSLIPWDFDSSFGQFGWDKINFSSSYEKEVKGCAIFKRLLSNEDFIIDCTQRWKELRNSVWSLDKIQKKISDNYNQIIHILNLEYELWKPITVSEDPGRVYPYFILYSTKEFSRDEYINDFLNFFPNQVEVLDEFFV